MPTERQGALDFDALLKRHIKAKSTCGLRRLLSCAQDRVEQAARIPWPALATSWQRNVDQTLKALEQLGQRG